MATRIPVIAFVALLAGTLAVTPEMHAQTTWYVTMTGMLLHKPPNLW